MSSRVQLSLLWLVSSLACARTTAPARSTPAQAADSQRASGLCHAQGLEQSECSLGGPRPLRVAVPFAARKAVARGGGGAYVLGRDGELARFDRRGRATGIFASQLVALAGLPGYVCGAEATGRVLCARDHHHDASCPAAESPAFFVVALTAAGPLHSRGGELCAADLAGRVRCTTVQARCDSLCVAYPACSPLRCVDPCQAQPPALQPLASGAIFFHHHRGL